MADTNEVQVEIATPLGEQEVDLRTDFKNFTPKLVLQIDRHFWVGRSVSKVSRIASNTGGVAVQRGTLPDGVKYGISYADGEDTTARKWVVAFDTKAQKAYAEAGPIGPIDWNVVEVKLDQLSGNKSEYEDKILGGKCSAEINGYGARAIFS